MIDIRRGKLADEVFADKSGRFSIDRGRRFDKAESLAEIGLSGAGIGEQDEFVGDEPLVEFAEERFEVCGVGFGGEDDLFGFSQ